MTSNYKFHCSKCGYYEECANKGDWHLAKSGHKTGGCGMHLAPLEVEEKNYWVLARPELAESMRKKWEKDHGIESNPPNGQQQGLTGGVEPPSIERNST